MSKYEQLKKNMKKFEQMYGEGILVGTLREARLAISDLEEELKELKEKEE